jgi:outer membrane protein assembly factor BamB
MIKVIVHIAICCLCFSLFLSGISVTSNNIVSSTQSLNKDLIYPYYNIPLTIGNTCIANEVGNTKSLSVFSSVLLSGQWPQQGINAQHIGRSPHSTVANPGIEKWRSPTSYWCFASPVIDANGTIYFGSLFIYAVNPNGSLKWIFSDPQGFGDYGSHPAIAEDGTLYIAAQYSGVLYAIIPNGTELWEYHSSRIVTSITVDDDGMLYYGHQEGVNALYPNGTLKWTFLTGDIVQSTPAVDENGIIYFGSHDCNIYAVYQNGTLKWNYTTAAWVHGSPTIASDGTIYCGSDDNYLYAFYPNGTLKWKTYTGSGMLSSPSLDKDGNLYFGMWHSLIMSVAPNGSIRWTFPLRDGDRIWGSTAAISDDGTLYIGNCIDMDMCGGGEIIALNLNGTLKWRKTICNSLLYSSPVIASDGTVYICGSNDGLVGAWGYLYAFNSIENNQPPEPPTINGPQEAKVRTNVPYILQADDPDNTPIHYLIDWGDGSTQQTPDYEPSIPVKYYHKWEKRGTYTIRVKAIDTFGLESDWATLTVTMPLSYEPPHFRFIGWLFECLPNAFPLLRYFFDNYNR